MAKKYKNELSAFDMAGTVFENGVKARERLMVQHVGASQVIPATPTSYPSR